jgi:hypothetical protein
MDAVALAVTSAITLVGLYLAHNLRRQQRLRIADQRIASYCHLWSRMAVARPSRVDPHDRTGPLTRKEARELYDEMTAWYFDSGNGMMLTDATATMYLVAKKRLAAFADGPSEADDVQSRAESERRMRELSLLRTQMKSDLAIYGRFDPGSLDTADEEFVRVCGMDPSRWARPRLQWMRTVPSKTAQGPRWPGSSGPDAPRARD